MREMERYIQQKVTANPLLFALGVMLLEIAYSSSFESLLEPQDYEISSDPRLVDFYGAQRLASICRHISRGRICHYYQAVFAL
jgi:hypothetical protein